MPQIAKLREHECLGWN